jgi:hypothetical protein
MIGHCIDHFYVDLSGAPESFIFMTKARLGLCVNGRSIAKLGWLKLTGLRARSGDSFAPLRLRES